MNSDSCRSWKEIKQDEEALFIKNIVDMLAAYETVRECEARLGVAHRALSAHKEIVTSNLDDFEDEVISIKTKSGKSYLVRLDVDGDSYHEITPIGDVIIVEN